MERINIEIHGYGLLSPAPSILRKKILELLRGKPYADAKKMVVTIIQSETIDVTLFQQPFIRILSSNSEAVKEIAEILEEEFPGMDVEHVQVAEFVSNRKM